MDWITVFFIAIALAMDAFAVSVSRGMIIRRERLRNALVFGIYFGFFQFIMPLAGYICGITLSSYIKAIDHWIAFGLLAFIGGRMLYETMKDIDENGIAPDKTLPPVSTMAVLALATSIDALAVGVSFAVVNTDIWTAAAVIGAVALIASFTGVLAGSKIGGILGKYAERSGGVTLIIIGIKILVEHVVLGY